MGPGTQDQEDEANAGGDDDSAGGELPPSRPLLHGCVPELDH